MCGIAGVLDTRADGRPGTDVVEAMLATIVHRGPDDSGVHDGGPLAMGVRRLKIIDLDGGHQPMTNEDASVWVVYNGELYNHRALRKELEASGHRFRTRCDTEVIVHAWEEWGEGCLQRFEGMYSFAVWRATDATLWLVRDRLGIKPLYYAWDGTRLVFGSEIKALLASDLVPREIDLEAFYYYVGYEFVPAPATMFRHVQKLPAGHRARVAGGRLDIQPYWDVSFEPAELSEAECISTIRQLLGAAIEKRLMADVQLGVFLSGGLDSTAVLAYARQASTQPLPSFTIGYRDESFSEWDYARRAAKYYGTEHHEIVIDPVTPELIEKTVWHLDEPMTDLSSIPFYMLCRRAREHATVCLSGEGGDEVFVGYDRFIASKIDAQWYSRLPAVLRRRLVEPAVAWLPDRPQKKGAINLLKRFVEGAALDPAGGHMRWQYFSSPTLDRALFRPECLAGVGAGAFEPVQRHAARLGTADRLSRECYVDLRLTMPDSVLMKVDKMSMASSLEVRVPFLDHALVEFAARMPSAYKFPGVRTKAIYRQAMVGVLPSFILERGKQGYSLPIKNWLREDLREYMTGLLNGSPLLQAQLQMPFVNTLIDEHMRRVRNHNHVLWALMNVALWHRRFIEEREAQAA